MPNPHRIFQAGQKAAAATASEKARIRLMGMSLTERLEAAGRQIAYNMTAKGVSHPCTDLLDMGYWAAPVAVIAMMHLNDPVKARALADCLMKVVLETRAEPVRGVQGIILRLAKEHIELHSAG